ncbi:MAG: MaoC family dehydratase N-terminal domain-containing protein [Novosphingobium sp.]|nr:MaoC family dehydratase N-terminal domain-containing protein [Novosphingobium sp.]
MSERPVLAADKLLGFSAPRTASEWTVRQTILYNLGIGFGAAAIEDDSLLRFVLEENTSTFPTMTAVMGSSGVGTVFFDPAYGIDYRMIVHGEEAVEIFAPLPAEGQILCDSAIEGVWDLGEAKGAVLLLSRRLYDADAKLLAKGTTTTMLRGNGGYGGSAEGAPRARPTPDRAPDGSASSITRPEQALIYRLSGDTNPLHSTPSVARATGFPAPILHGLCTYGVCARLLVRALAGGDETRLTFYKIRLSSPVYPGETIRVEWWDEGRGTYAFQARVEERDVVVVKGGEVRFA